MSSFIAVPSPIVAFVSRFPLKTNPPIVPIDKTRLTAPTLWILPPRSTSEPLLSGDVECLKWQAYLALRGLRGIKIRWDIAPEGALTGSLPNLHIPNSEATRGENLKKPEDAEDGKLLAAHSIPAWVDMKLGVDSSAGYKDQEARTESRAWVSLLEGTVHAALVSMHSHGFVLYLCLCCPDYCPTTPFVLAIHSFPTVNDFT
jgi:metaxin